MSSETTTFPAFSGFNDDCETFISSVQQLALSKEKHSDDKWIAGLVAGCLYGDALLWFAALDSGSQESWHTLRLKLLERYTGQRVPRPASTQARSLKRHSRASSVTSAASSESSAYSTSSTSNCSSPATPYTPKQLQPPSTPTVIRAGKIAVTCGVKGSCGYVGRSPGADGVFYVTTNASEALHVQLEPSSDGSLSDMRLLNSSVSQEQLGVTWYNSGSPGLHYGSASISGLSATRITPLVVESSAADLYRGPEASKIWSLGDDNALEAKWPTGAGHGHTLTLAVGPGNLLYFLPDQSWWIEGSWFGRYVQARLTFEPFVRPTMHSRNSSTLSLPSPARLTALKLQDGINPKVRFSHAAQDSVDWSTFTLSPTPKPAILGRIKVTSSHPSGNGYVGTTLSNTGVLSVKQASDDMSLQVRCPEGRGILHNLELMNPRTQHNWLGFTWAESKTPNMCPGSSSIAALSYIGDGKWGALSTSTSRKYPGEKGHAIWNVHDDGTIRATWFNGVARKSLVFVINPATQELYAVPDKTSSWLGEFWGYARVTLSLEKV